MRNSIVQGTHLLLKISAYTAISKDRFAFQYGVVLTHPRQFDSFLAGWRESCWFADRSTNIRITRQVFLRLRISTYHPESWIEFTSNTKSREERRWATGSALDKNLKIFGKWFLWRKSIYYYNILREKYSALSPLCIFNNSQRKWISWSALSLIYSYKYVWGAKKKKDLGLCHWLIFYLNECCVETVFN